MESSVCTLPARLNVLSCQVGWRSVTSASSVPSCRQCSVSAAACAALRRDPCALGRPKETAPWRWCQALRGEVCRRVGLCACRGPLVFRHPSVQAETSASGPGGDLAATNTETGPPRHTDLPVLRALAQAPSAWQVPYFDGWLFHPAWCQPSRQQAGKSAVIHEGSSIAPAGSLLQTWRTIRAGLEVPDPLQHLHNPWHNLFHEPCSPPPCSKQVASSCSPEISFPALWDL